jgi:hypothetical protein
MSERINGTIKQNSPNPYFNMSKKSIQQTKGYKKRYNT